MSTFPIRPMPHPIGLTCLWTKDTATNKHRWPTVLELRWRTFYIHDDGCQRALSNIWINWPHFLQDPQWPVQTLRCVNTNLDTVWDQWDHCGNITQWGSQSSNTSTEPTISACNQIQKRLPIESLQGVCILLFALPLISWIFYLNLTSWTVFPLLIGSWRNSPHQLCVLHSCKCCTIFCLFIHLYRILYKLHALCYKCEKNKDVKLIPAWNLQLNSFSLHLWLPHRPNKNLEQSVCLWFKCSSLLVWAGHVNVQHLHINSAKNSFNSSPTSYSWLCSTLTSTDRPNLLSFTANREGICLVYRVGLFTPRCCIKVVCISRAGAHRRQLRRRRWRLRLPLCSGNTAGLVSPSTRATEAPFEVQQRKSL